MIRLDKLLSDNGLGSRKTIRQMVRSGRVFINDEKCKDFSTKIQIEKDQIKIDGEIFEPRLFVYLMLNKPSGVITSTFDKMHKTVLDILSPPWSSMKLHPIGRLDLNTEGLLIITNDGDLTHFLTSPRKSIPKTYLVNLKNPLSKEDFLHYKKQFEKGIKLHNGYKCMPAKIELKENIKENTNEKATTVLVTIVEGKFHQVKKMFSALENEVVFLKRISMGNLKLDENLNPGMYRELTRNEITSLKNFVKNKTNP